MAKKRRKKPPVRKNEETNSQIENDNVVKSEAPQTERSSRKTATTRNRPSSSKERKPKRKSRQYTAKDMLFGRENYTYMIAGVVLMIIGFILMRGGAMPDDNTWDPNLIYSFRRITLAPILILAGLGVEIYAIFKSNSNDDDVNIEEAEA